MLKKSIVIFNIKCVPEEERSKKSNLRQKNCKLKVFNTKLCIVKTIQYYN